MRKIIFITMLLNCYIVIKAGSVFAQSKILINEFLIDPQPQQAEIINVGTESSDISGWVIDDSGGTTYYIIPPSSILNPNSCLVFSGDFNLNKSSADTIKLINNAEIIDSFSYKSSSGSDVSYQRLPDGENNWATGSANIGFYNSRRVQACLFPIPVEPTPTNPPTPTETEQINPSPTETQTPTPNQTPTSYDNIFLSEVMINPESGQGEWVEFYNNNDFSAFLTNWFIDDLENAGSTPKAFSLEIPAKGYKVFNLTSSIFNNNGDSVRLLDFNKTLKDDFEYNSSAQGKTLGRTDFSSDNFCLQEPSYELTNNSCLNPTEPPIPSPPPLKTSIPTKTAVTTNKLAIKPSNYNLLIHHNSISQPINYYEGEVLGISTKSNKNNVLSIRLLSFISLFYSLLTIGAVLFKMKFIYGNGKKFLSSFIYPSGTK